MIRISIMARRRNTWLPSVLVTDRGTEVGWGSHQIAVPLAAGVLRTPFHGDLRAVTLCVLVPGKASAQWEGTCRGSLRLLPLTPLA